MFYSLANNRKLYRKLRPLLNTIWRVSFSIISDFNYAPIAQGVLCPSWPTRVWRSATNLCLRRQFRRASWREEFHRSYGYQSFRTCGTCYVFIPILDSCLKLALKHDMMFCELRCSGIVVFSSLNWCGPFREVVDLQNFPKYTKDTVLSVSFKWKTDLHREEVDL